VKKTTFLVDDLKFTVMQLIDITNRIQYQKVVGEKNMLQMTNACVSHEMRNPLNAISCQNLRLEEAIKMIMDILDNKDIKTVRKMKREIRKISYNLVESLKIQMASTKLLNFYVNDILCLAQINSDKFRKDYSNLNIK